MNRVEATRRVRRYALADEEAAFHRQMLENPDDTTTPLVYADWLDENGRPGLATLLRSHAGWQSEIQEGERSRGEPVDPFMHAVDYSPLPGNNFHVLAATQYPEWGVDLIDAYHAVPGHPGRHWHLRSRLPRRESAAMVRDLMNEGFVPHADEGDDEEARMNQTLIDAGRPATHPPAQLARRYAAYRAPAGGMVARGTAYQGGKFVPDMQGAFMNPPPKKIDRKKLAAHARRMKSKKITVKPGTDDRTDASGPQTPLVVGYARGVRRYAMGDDVNTFVHQITQQPEELSTRGAFADYLDENNLADPEHLDALRSHPGPVRPIVHPNGRVTVHPWVTPRDQYRMANAAVTDARYNAGEMEYGLGAGGLGADQQDAYVNLPHHAENALADALAAHHDPRERIVRAAADRDRAARRVMAVPPADYVIGNLDAPLGTGVAAEQTAEREHLGVGGLDEAESLGGMGPSYAVESRPGARYGKPIQLPDGTHLSYEVFHAPETGRHAVEVRWHAPARNNFEAIMNPEDAANTVGALAPGHGDRIRQLAGLGSQPHQLSRGYARAVRGLKIPKSP